MSEKQKKEQKNKKNRNGQKGNRKKARKKEHPAKIVVLTIILTMIVILALPLIFGNKQTKVVFNQQFIEHLDAEYEVASIKDKMHSGLSYYARKLNNMLRKPKENYDYENEESVFSMIYSNLPYYSIIYPTEYYYYWNIEEEDRTVTGNLRLVNVKEGSIGLGYFRDDDPRVRGKAKNFTEKDGLKIKRITNNVYKLTYEGKSVYFRLPSIMNDPPRQELLGEGEEFVTKVRDESGIIFYLLYHSETKSFYYALDEERKLTDTLKTVGEKLLVGERTGFVYYEDEGRKILVGASANNIFLNNYYDGPFDQVDPFANLKQKIYLAYPYTQFGSGIDDYGNIIDSEHTRVAITPYYKYKEIEDMKELLKECEREERVIECLTYEPKKDYHKDSPLFNADGTLKNKTQNDPIEW